MLAGSAEAEPSREAPVAVEVVGRLTVEWTDREPGADGEERFTGSVLDELGQPVAASLALLGKTGARLSPCVGGARPPDVTRLATTHDGRFCFIARSSEGEFSLRVEAPHHEPTDTTPPRTSSLGPRILRAPRSVDLDSNTSATFEVLPAPTSRASRVELYVECGGDRVRLHDAPTDRGLVRAEVEPGRIPGPGACRVLAEQVLVEQASANEHGRLRSRAHPLLAIAKATLEVESTSVEDGVTTVALTVTLGRERKRLDAGVIEVWQDAAFVASAPIDGGKAMAFIPHGPRPMTARISVADGGPGVMNGDPVELPIAALAPHASKSALVGWMVFGALGLWLVWLWLGRDRRPLRKDDGNGAYGPGVDFNVPARGDRAERLAGRVTDAYTKEALAKVRVVLEAPEVAGVRLIAETLTSNDGTFHFDQRHDPSKTRRLRFEHDGYVSRESRVTGARVVARLVSLRHALLGALHTRGQNMTKHRLTPSELARIALHRGNTKLANWALAIERAVYGPRTLSHERVRSLLAGDDPPTGTHANGERSADERSEGEPSAGRVAPAPHEPGPHEAEQ